MSFITRIIEPTEVRDAETFGAYCQQKLGVPYPSKKDIATLKKAIKDFFAKNPQADWGTLVRIVHWAKNRRKRPAHAYVLLGTYARWAYADGFLPELDPRERVEENIEKGISEALRVETDPFWRQRLLGSSGRAARRLVLQAWREEHRPVAV